MTDATHLPKEESYKCECGWEGTADQMSRFMVRQDLDTGSRFCPRCQQQLLMNWKQAKAKQS
jgi:hypothetical protein